MPIGSSRGWLEVRLLAEGELLARKRFEAGTTAGFPRGLNDGSRFTQWWPPRPRAFGKPWPTWNKAGKAGRRLPCFPDSADLPANWLGYQAVSVAPGVVKREQIVQEAEASCRRYRRSTTGCKAGAG